jgi:hypothetical protein
VTVPPQIASIVCTVAIAILTGSIAGWIVSAVNPAGHRLSAAQLFDDGAYWQVGRVCMKCCLCARLYQSCAAVLLHARCIRSVRIGS